MSSKQSDLGAPHGDDRLTAPSRDLGLPVIDPRDTPALSFLGHDLRAALSEVVGALRLIEAERLPAPARLQIARMTAASEALSLLLEQAIGILLGSEVPLHSPNLQTDRLLGNLKLRWTARLRALGMQFQLLAAPDLPTQLGLDAALFERVTSNLIGNAAKYAATGRVTCRIGVLNETRLEISVQDEGPGFSSASLAQIDTGQAMGAPIARLGTGLGLLIVQDMVQAAGGSVDISNRPDGGALVIVSLPLLAISQHPPADPTTPQPDLSHLRILLADDSVTHRTLHQQLLSQMGAEVVLAKDGVETISRIERDSFDLAIIDIEMPYFNGLDVIRHIRAMSGAMSKLPILALTSHAGPEASARIAAVGVDCLMQKPVPSAAAFGQAVLHAHQQNAPAVAGPPTAKASVVNADQFANLLQMAGPIGASKILSHIHLDLARTERELIAASQGPNWAAIRAQTHVLVALAGTAGADELSHQAQTMNQLAHAAQPDRGTFLTLLPQILESLRELLQFIAMKTLEHEAKP